MPLPSCHVFLGSFSAFATVTAGPEFSLSRVFSLLVRENADQPFVDSSAKDGKVSLIMTRGENNWGLGGRGRTQAGQSEV